MTKYSKLSKSDLINRISTHMANCIIRFFKNIKKSTKCDVCLEITPVVKVCKCSFNICSTCIKCLHNENQCPYCRCSHMEYLNTLPEFTKQQEKIKKNYTGKL